MKYKVSTLKNKTIQGFTLIEILIALFIFAIIATITTGILFTVFNTRDQINQRMTQLGRLQVVVALLQQDISQIVNRPIRTPGMQKIGAFVGNEKQIAFTRGGISNPLGLSKRSTLQRIAYGFNHGNLYRETWPVLDRTSHTKSETKIILTNISDLQFKFIGKNNHIYTNWPLKQKTSQKDVVLPRAVEIDFTLKKWGNMTLLILISAGQSW